MKPVLGKFVHRAWLLRRANNDGCTSFRPLVTLSRYLKNIWSPDREIMSASSWTDLWKYSSGQIFWSPLIGCSAARRRVAPLPVGSCEFEPVLSKFSHASAS